MKKWLFVFIFAILCVTLLTSQEYDIRKLKWGMSYDKVTQIEGLGSELFKQERLLGMKVEVAFGCGARGLYSVTYTSEDRSFAVKASAKLNQKYGNPREGLDYSFLMDISEVLKQFPEVVDAILTSNNFALLGQIEVSYEGMDVRKALRGAMSKRTVWEGGNTIALMLDSPDKVVLSYRPKKEHYANKKKFEAVWKEIKSKISKKKKIEESTDNF